MPTRRTVVAYGSLLGAGSLAGCVGREPAGSSTGNGGSAGDNGATDGDASSDINEDAALEATLAIDDEERVLFTSTDIATVGPVSTGGRTGPSVPLELSEARIDSVTETADSVDLDTTYERATITVTLDGERVNQFGINSELAVSMANGEWNGELVLVFADEAAAEAFRDRLVGEPAA